VTSSEPIPIAEIYRLREELALAIERQKWKTAKNRANAIIKLLPCAIHKDSKVSALHISMAFTILDGSALFMRQSLHEAPLKK
jgi:hypothetical protein